MKASEGTMVYRLGVWEGFNGLGVDKVESDGEHGDMYRAGFGLGCTMKKEHAPCPVNESLDVVKMANIK